MRVALGRWLAPAAAMLVSAFVYLPWPVLTGTAALRGMDYAAIHERRLVYARDALAHGEGVPGWSPREFLGAPFAANLQSFPWIPNRLVLLVLDPAVAYAVGVALAASLACLFTFLYCRRIGLEPLGASVAGATFALAGYFASRVLAGHLPLLEAYPSLPLLLWLIERQRDPDAPEGPGLLLLGLASCAILLAGHPQIPAYALAAALVYALVRLSRARAARSIVAMGLGGGLALFAWWPMLLLIRRSTRTLPLAPPSNDVLFPFSRLPALLFPGWNGFPPGVSGAESAPLKLADPSIFWDTASYVGWVPWLAAAAALLLCLRSRRKPEQPWLFLVVLGAVAFAGALPLLQPLRTLVPGTFLRSPARLLYLWTFAMVVGAGWGFDRLQALWPGRRWLAGVAVAIALAFHGVDLGRFTERFVQPVPRETAKLGPVEEIFTREVRDGRVAVDRSLGLPLGDRFDDVGVFDSILLARPYRMLLALSGAPPGINVQTLSGGRQLSTEALAASGVVMALTTARRRDLQPLGTAGALALYRVPGPDPRVSFHPASAVRFETEDALVAAVRSPGGRRRPGLSLVPEARSAMPSVVSMVEGEATTVYRRPAGDRIEVDVTAPAPGFLEVLEADDPGWSAEVDGRTAPVFLASGMVMAVPLTVAGAHHVVLRYQTPGATAGRVASLLCFGLLLGLLLVVHRAERREAATAPTPAS